MKCSICKRLKTRKKSQPAHDISTNLKRHSYQCNLKQYSSSILGYYLNEDSSLSFFVNSDRSQIFPMKWLCCARKYRIFNKDTEYLYQHLHTRRRSYHNTEATRGDRGSLQSWHFFGGERKPASYLKLSGDIIFKIGTPQQEKEGHCHECLKQ